MQRKRLQLLQQKKKAKAKAKTTAPAAAKAKAAAPTPVSEAEATAEEPVDGKRDKMKARVFNELVAKDKLPAEAKRVYDEAVAKKCRLHSILFSRVSH